MVAMLFRSFLVFEYARVTSKQKSISLILIDLSELAW